MLCNQFNVLIGQMPKPLTRGCIGYPYILLHAYGWRVKDKEGYVMLQLTYVIELKTVEDW